MSPLRFAIVLLIVLILVLATTSFQLREGENAVLTRFGNPTRVLVEPGLYFKWPAPIEVLHRLDARLNIHDVRISQALTKDKRSIIVPVFVAWRVGDPKKFLEATRTFENAQNRLDSLVGSTKDTVLANYEMRQLVSTDPQELQLGRIEDDILARTAPLAAGTLGIEIEQVGIERLTLPEANTSYVFDRMRAERSQFAAKFRAEGQQEADAIMAQANAEKTRILAEAEKYSEETRGKAEAEAARIYASAHGQDPEFYKFLRELETLKKVINQNTTIVLDTDSPLFELLRKQPQPPAKAAP